MSDSSRPAASAERRPDANAALLLSWFLPGSGHVWIGRPLLGLVVFVGVELLYALGWILSDGRSFEFLDPELRGRFATLLTPEVGNLGAMVLQHKLVGFGASELSPFPPHVALGAFLTALSGFVNLCFLVHVHLAARTPADAPKAGPHPALLVFLAWLVPGLGHLAQRRFLRGAIVFVLLVGLFAWGTGLAEASNLSRERHFYYWSGQFLVGLPALLAEEASGRPPVTGDIALVDAGLVFACMAGLLNVLAMLDVQGVAERRWSGRSPAPSAAEPVGADQVGPGPETAP